MTVSSEAKRTLVKSPPELWSEVSDAESLARHLDGLQEIRITRVEPETAVEWEADGASGSVRLQPSGFGTRVTLSLSRELSPRESVAVEPDLASEPEPAADSQPVAEREPVVEPEPIAEREPIAESGTAAESDPIVHIEPAVPVNEPAVTQMQAEPSEPSRVGFFARLFKRRGRPLAPTPEPAAPTPEPEAPSEPGPEESLSKPTTVVAETEQAIAPESESAPEPVESESAPEPVEQTTSVAGDLATLEAEMAEQDQAMLTAMLDRLGAAHHRPFSRS